MEANPTCFSCRGPLKDGYITAHGQNYHPHHFRCTVCSVSLDFHDINFWHDNLVFCRFHYSTRFAPKCAGCTTAVLTHFVIKGEDERWHTECYILDAMWCIKLAPPGRQIKFSNTPGLYVVEEHYYNSQSLVAEQIQVEEQVHWTWDNLSTFETSAAVCLKTCIRMIIHDGRPDDKEAWLIKSKQHSEAILEALDVFEPHLHDAEVDAPKIDVRMLGERLWYLDDVCRGGAPWTYPVDQLEEEVIRLIHGMTCRAVAGALYLSYQQEHPSAANYLLHRLRGVSAEGVPSLPLTGPHDLRAVYETTPFDMLLGRPTLESPEPTITVIPEPPILTPHEIGNMDAKIQARGVEVAVRTNVPQRPVTPSPVAIRRLRSPPQVLRRRSRSPSRRVLRRRSKTPPAAAALATPRSGSPRSARRRSRSRSPQVAARRPRSRSRSLTPRRQVTRGRSRTPPVAAAMPTPRTRSPPRIVLPRSRSRSRTPIRNVLRRKPRNPAQTAMRTPRSRSPRAARRRSRSRSPQVAVRRPRSKSPSQRPKSPHTMHFPASSQSSHLIVDDLNDGSPSSRNLFNSAPSSSAALMMSIAQLCQYLRSTPQGQILSLVRRKEISGVRHEFLVMRAREPSGRIIWLRMERAAKRVQSGIRMFSSTFPARDTARISGTEDDILYEEEPSTVEADVSFDSPPTLLNLEKLLTIVTEESVLYKLWPENCFFFASVIQENLSIQHGGRLLSGKLGHKTLARDVRNRIRARVDESY